MSGILLALALTGAQLMDTRPPVEDALRLPDLEWLTQQRAVAVAAANDFERQATALWAVCPDTPPWQQATAAHQEAAALAEWYWYAQRAGDSLCDTDERRNALDYCRSCLGAEAYYAGRWPPALPWWRLPRYSSGTP